MKGQSLKRMLVADDEDVILFSYKKIFSSSSLHVDVCKTPEEALEMIRKNRYHVVISDIRFSDSENTDGLKILGFVKEHSPTTEVIIVTGYGSSEIREKTLNLGASYYFDKPVEISMMDNVLTKMGVIPDINCSN